MSKPFLVMLNGPPGSGKDYAAQVLMEADDLTVSHHKFAAPLKQMAGALFNINAKAVERLKSSIFDDFGVTLRQILIDMSEKWMKPCYGKDIFGKIAAYKIAEEFQLVDTEILSDRDLYVFSDCGFDAEVHHVLKLFGNENAILIRLHRDGCTYEGDSRSYIELDDVRTIDIVNHGNSFFKDRVLEAVKNWMNERKNNAQS